MTDGRSQAGKGRLTRGLLALGCTIALAASPASAESLRDRLNQGTQAVGKAVNKAARQVDQTIDSTVDLATNEATPAETRAKLDRMSDTVLASLLAQNPAAAVLFDQSAGYAVFDTRKATVLGVVAGFGRGVAVSRETGARTYMNMGTGGVGLSFGVGGFETQVIFLFQDAGALEGFIRYGYDATAVAGSMFGDETVEQGVRFSDGRSIFVLGKKGWKVSASAAGTKYWMAPQLN